MKIYIPDGTELQKVVGMLHYLDGTLPIRFSITYEPVNEWFLRLSEEDRDGHRWLQVSLCIPTRDE